MSTKAFPWAGKHVVITGGSSGIGEALAVALAVRGTKLTLLARGADRLAAVAGPLGATGVPCDVSDRDAVAGVLAAAAEERGPVDVLVCSAGITLPGRFLEAEDQTFRDMIDVDYYGTLWPVRAVAPSMAERQTGSIVGVASAAALVGVYGYAAYGAAKFAVRGLFETLRTELVPHGVHVGCVFPPDVDTPMLAAENLVKPAETKAIAGSIKPIAADQVAQAVIRGVEKRQAEIYADAQTRALARTVATAPGIYRTLFDRRVRTA
ncbi:MAG TPA: SDR family oxidoreductase [Acidimicrobiales bacterium]|nr:SDR family oxidoreductase [Acidimicrobiales bacterium]